ncbi:hypothetical protein BD413DRAFT_190870 [Trametes elegans]|nr:hypothetical protein BD413DRAFT_190870 [Trametes elegans]
MSTEEAVRDTSVPAQEASMQVEATPAPDAEGVADAKPSTKKRPRIDMDVEPRERKRGKTMFGLVLGTLAKAKNEDKERNASDAVRLPDSRGRRVAIADLVVCVVQAKKRQLIEQRLQDKLRKETDSVRRAEEAKRDKTTANRKEEELQLKDSIHKLRRTRLPLLSNFLLTSDVIPPADSDAPTSANPLAPPPRTRPAPLYYLPAKLLPSQEAFLQRRKAEVKEAAEKEWEAFKAERAAGIEEINGLRKRVAEEEDRRKAERPEGGEKVSLPSPDKEDAKMAVEGEGEDAGAGEKPAAPASGAAPNGEAKMDVDEGGAAPLQPSSGGAQSSEKKDEAGGQGQDGEAKAEKEKTEGAGKEKKADAAPAPAPGYDDDAVEY